MSPQRTPPESGVRKRGRGQRLAPRAAWSLIAAILLGVVVAAQPQPRATTNLLLITLDTVRADRLGAYGYKLASTPALDRLAREGVRFADASTQAPLTGPAHAAILTGAYPARFGVRDNGTTPLPPETTTLAEVLKKAGYRTGGFIGAFILDRAYGFDQGFETFDSHFERFAAGDKLKVERRAEQVVAPAIAWLESLPPGQPFFAWVHLFDAHAPYSPPPPFDAKFRDRPYDGEIAYVDAAAGRLVRALETRGLIDRTIVVAIGDHGEALGEHGEEDHGLFLYDSVLRIPWLMRLPGRVPAGVTIGEQVRAIDLMPTVLDLLGLTLPPGMDGESLAPVIRGKARPNPPPSYAETYYPKLHFGWSELLSIRVGEWKYVDAPTPELFDLRVDAGERTNVLSRQAGVAGRLGAELQQISTRFAAAAPAAPAPPDPETLERLRSLGYVGFVAPAPSSKRGADPKDMVASLTTFRRLLTDATDDLRQRQPARAIVKLKQALALFDRAYDVHLALGDAYVELRQYDRAIGEYEAAALLNPSTADPLLAAASAFIASGRLDEATRKIGLAAALEPRSHEVALARARVFEERRQNADALVEYQRAVDRNPSDPRSRGRLANLALEMRRLDIAEAQFGALLEMGYQPARMHYGLGRVAEARGDRPTALTEYRAALALDPNLEPARSALARLEQRK